jgi:hypothetical protein
MPWIASTQTAGATFGSTGTIYRIFPDAGNREMSLPEGVNAVNQRPSFARYNADGVSRLYGVGGWTDNLVVTENYQVFRQSILAPMNTILAGAGSGNAIGVTTGVGLLTGTAIAYVSWWDDIHARRSPLSAGGPSMTLVNHAVVFANLPTTCPDPSVTHIDMWLSLDGNTPRLACRRTLGATGATYAGANLSLGEAFDTEISKFPRGRFNKIWNYRQAVAGDDRYPDRIYFSPIQDPENYSGFYLNTKNGEPIVALAVVRESLIVFGPRSSYVVTGYTENDMTLQFLEPEIGCISHHGIAMIHGLAMVPTHFGFYLCTGSSMHPVSQDFMDTWRAEYAANRNNYEAGFGVNSIEENCYKFYSGIVNTSTIDSMLDYKYVTWVLDYSNVIGEVGGNYAPPGLMLDVKDREDTVAAELGVPGARRSDLFVGGADGKIRQENSSVDLDDDGDTYGKRMIIRSKHYFPFDAGGSEEDGASYPNLWNYMESETAGYSIELYAGDEKATKALAVDWSQDVPEGEVVLENVTHDEYTLVPKCVHNVEPGITGRGLTFQINQLSPPADVRWSGFGFTVFPGHNSRSVAFVRRSE